MIEFLATIPLIEAPRGPLQLARLQPERTRGILKKIHRLLPPPLLRWGDRYSEDWLERSANPHLNEIREIAGLLGKPGGYALNFSFEMGCTTGCHAPDAGSAMRLYRSLDWPFRLGADIVVARHQPPAGSYYNITWPGYVGVLTGLAPGRFAAAINQPPMTYSFDRFSLGLPIDWVVNRLRIRKLTALPPVHLLRQAFEQCTTYDEAKNMLVTTPICIPVIYTMTGTKPGEGCIIERRENEAILHEGPACIANHWINDRFKGRPRHGAHSRKRLAKMRDLLPVLKGHFDWLVPPVLWSFTRMAAELDAAAGTLFLQGWHGGKPQTRMLELGPGLQ